MLTSFSLYSWFLKGQTETVCVCVCAQVWLWADSGPGGGAEREKSAWEAESGERHTDWGSVQPPTATGGQQPLTSYVSSSAFTSLKMQYITLH